MLNNLVIFILIAINPFIATFFPSSQSFLPLSSALSSWIFTSRAAATPSLSTFQLFILVHVYKCCSLLLSIMPTLKTLKSLPMRNNFEARSPSAANCFNGCPHLLHTSCLRLGWVMVMRPAPNTDHPAPTKQSISRLSDYSSILDRNVKTNCVLKRRVLKLSKTSNICRLIGVDLNWNWTSSFFDDKWEVNAKD